MSDYTYDIGERNVVTTQWRPHKPFSQIPREVIRFVASHPWGGNVYLYLYELSYGRSSKSRTPKVSYTGLSESLGLKRPRIQKIIQHLAYMGAIDPVVRDNLGTVYSVLLPVYMKGSGWVFLPPTSVNYLHRKEKEIAVEQQKLVEVDPD